MERLRFKECKTCKKWTGCMTDCLNTCGKPLDALEEFNRYKDLEQRLQSVYGECEGLLEKVVEYLFQHEGIKLPDSIIKARLLINEDVDSWNKYKDLEKQGKPPKPPCTVGDKIYLPNKYVGKVISFDITEVCIFADEIIFVTDWENEYSLDDFGKTVFATEEEAEAVLKELEG